jgi:cysteine desulfurase
MANKRVFLDYASITPVDNTVAKEIERIEKKFWANPASLHTEGEGAKKILEEARIRIARILHCKASEIFFTSGGTESLSIAILGVVRAAKKKPHIITSAIEHPAVLEPIKSLLKNGEAEASFIAPNEKGIISPESIRKEIKENTVLIAIQHGNNEIGTIQPVREISKIVHDLIPNPLSLPNRPVLLVDTSQSVLYEDVSIERLGADILVVDGIKMYGPRGAGILAVKRSVEISPVVPGGGQEGGIRSGTQNVPAAAGLAKALEIAEKMREKESLRLKKLRDYAIEKILSEIPGALLNGDQENRLPNNINVCFSHSAKASRDESNKLDSEFLVIKLDTMGFAVSAASACHTLSLENSSYVIESVSGKECASSSLRITLGRDTEKADLDKFISALKKIIK